MTVLTPPLAVSLSRTDERSNRRQTSAAVVFTDHAAGAETCEQKPPVPGIVISPAADEKADDKVGSMLRCEIALDNSRAGNLECDNNKQVSSVKVNNRTAGSSILALADQHGDERLDVPLRSAEVDVVDLCTEPRADGSLVGYVARDTDVNISDSSFHLDTQMLCAIAAPAASDDNKMTNVVRPQVPTTDQLMSESLLDTSSELDGLGPNSATCQFMKEFSTQKCAEQTNAAVSRHNGGGEGSHGVAVSVPVDTVHNPLEPEVNDLPVSNTCELMASSGFDQICAASHDETNRQIVYSEEMLFDDSGEHVHAACRQPLVSRQNDRLPTGMHNNITSDLTEERSADDCIENKSDLFASYIEEPDAAARAEMCSVDLPATANSFVLAHDSLTSTMLDRAMEAANQALVGNQLNNVVCRPPACSDTNTNVVTGNQPVNPQTDVRENPQADILTSHNTEPPDVDAEAALHLLCETSHMSAKKPPKRRGRKRNSDSADLLNKSGASAVEEKTPRMLSRSPKLPVDIEIADVSLNQAVCLSVSFGSTSDSSAYVPPTPPSTATEKSNINTPRRLLGGVSGITPVKSEQSVHQVCEIKKNVSQSKGCDVKEMAQDEGNGHADVTVGNREVKVGESFPHPSQGPHCSQSFTIIDVAANRLLFDTFIAEWQQQTSFSLSLACEKCPKPQARHPRRSNEGIGARYVRGSWITALFLSNWIIVRTRHLMDNTVFAVILL